MLFIFNFIIVQEAYVETQKSRDLCEGLWKEH